VIKKKKGYGRNEDRVGEKSGRREGSKKVKRGYQKTRRKKAIK